MATYTVLDVSKYNTVTDYSVVSAAIDGVIMRTGYRGYGSSGTLVKYSLFETHYAGFSGKTKLGVYWCAQAISEAEAGGDGKYVDRVAEGKTIGFPVWRDSEYANSNHNGRAEA